MGHPAVIQVRCVAKNEGWVSRKVIPDPSLVLLQLGYSNLEKSYALTDRRTQLPEPVLAAVVGAAAGATPVPKRARRG
jgi:hypothetical protein